MSGSMRPSEPGEPRPSGEGHVTPQAGSEPPPSGGAETGTRAGGDAPRAEVLEKGAVYDRSRDRAERLIRENRNFVADYVDSFVKGLAAMERALDDEGRDETATQVHRAAEELRRASRKVREDSLMSFARQMESRARERPMLAFGGAALAGFALSRLLKSRPEHDGQEDNRGEPRARTQSE